MVVCRFFQQGNCKFGDNCKFEHPGARTDSGFASQNRFGAFQSPANGGGIASTAARTDTSWGINTLDVKNDLTAGKGRPQWILSTYGPGKGPPASLLEGNEYSFEELRVRFYELNAAGNQDQANQEAAGLWSKAEQTMADIANNAGNVIKFMEDAEKKHPNRYDFCKVDGTKSRDQIIKEVGSGNVFGNTPAFGQPTAFGQPSTAASAFGRPAPTFGRPAASSGMGSGAFGQPAQPSSFGQPSGTFGQPAASAFGKPSSGFGQPTFGQSSQPTPAFGQASQPTPAFGQAAQSSGFGSTGFGQPSALGGGKSPFGAPSASSAFGQPSQTTTAFGQASKGGFGSGAPAQQSSAFGQPSQPASAFGQPSQPTTAFGQPSQPTPAFGQPSQPTPAFGQTAQSSTAFGQPSQPTTAFGQPSAPTPSFGQPSQSSTFGKPVAAPAFGAPSAPTSTFGKPTTPQSSNPSGTSASAPTAFGQPPQPAPASSGAFGQPASTSTTNNNAFTRPPSAPSAAFGTAAPGTDPFSSTTSQPTTNPAVLPPNTNSSATPHSLTNKPPRPLHYTQTLPVSAPTSIDPQTKRLRTYRGRPVRYIHDNPCYDRPDGKGWERIWFPQGSETPDVVALGKEDKIADLVVEQERYTEEVRREFTYLFEMGQFKDGRMPAVPPKREWCVYDF